MSVFNETEMTVVLRDDAKESYLYYVANVFGEEALLAWFNKVRLNAKWEEKNRGDGAFTNSNESNSYGYNKYRSNYDEYARKVPRLVAWYTYDNDCSCIYKYGTIACKPNKWQDWLQDITQWVLYVLKMKCEAKYSHLLDYPPNSCNINLYRNGKDCAGWHCDDEPLFETEYVFFSFLLVRKFYGW